MSGDNFRYNAGEMEAIISSLESARTEMDSTMEKVKSELRDKLLQAGMSGPTADALLATFQKEVVNPTTQYLDTAMSYITKNKNVNNTMSETSQANIKIAS